MSGRPVSARPVHLCADIGTSSLKAALVDGDGSLLAFAREAYPGEDVASHSVGAGHWEGAFGRACAGLVRSAREDGVSIASVCISGNGPTLVPVGPDGAALDLLAWYDGRTVPGPESDVAAGDVPGTGQPDAGAGQGPADLGRSTRPPRLDSFFLSRIAWLRAERPDLFERTKLFLSSQEYLSWKLGADPVTVLPSEGYRPYYWDAAQLGAWRLDGSLLPPFVGLGERLGTVSADAAARFGVPAGTPIVSGGPDFLMALAGTGTLSPGAVCDRAGTSEGVNVCSERPSSAQELRTLPQLREGLWNVAVMLPTTGRLFEWFRVITGQTDRDYRCMLEEIASAAPRPFTGAKGHGGGFFFPDLRSVGALDAASAFISTAGLTSRAELGRAVVEAIGFMVRGAVETLEARGYRVEGMRLSGGQAKNELWNRLKADITGRYLAVPEIADGELAGDACASLICLGEADGFEEAASRIVRIDRVYEPDQKAYAVHSERYDSYKSMLARMERFFQ